VIKLKSELGLQIGENFDKNYSNCLIETIEFLNDGSL